MLAMRLEPRASSRRTPDDHLHVERQRDALRHWVAPRLTAHVDTARHRYGSGSRSVVEATRSTADDVTRWIGTYWKATISGWLLLSGNDFAVLIDKLAVMVPVAAIRLAIRPDERVGGTHPRRVRSPRGDH